jgi:cysteine desulfurase/selenocysteine lyase
MIRTVTLTESTWNELPWKFEAGTMNIAEAVGLGAAVQVLESLGMEHVFAHDRELAGYTMQRLAELPGRARAGPARGPARRRGVVHRGGCAPSRRGHRARPRWGCACAPGTTVRCHSTSSWGCPPALARRSTAIRLPEDVDALVNGLRQVQKVFGR